ncbi:hypothetical protein [Szabonella alba]|uniref:LysM domain-containing protein n=1 Tax=Szabonella alba TaxID=2804194 RepID=A0A8K0V8M6_9RHOB|nr:hypothetical protein [Szabonella alba]MBL4917156.1 hypothetical protein [Szabonella alba]
MSAAIPKPKAEHKVRKGETYDKIGKKYGFRNFDDIWKYPKNAALVKLRKDPKSIQPDDIVVIPAYNDEERKEIQDRQRKYLYAANMEKLAASRFADQAAADRKLADAIDRMAAEHKAAGDAYMKEYLKSVKKADNWSKGVDYANMVFGIVNALRGLVLKSAQATQALAKNAAKEFEKISNSLIADSKVFMYAPLISEGTKAAGKALTDQKSGPLGDFMIFGGVVIESIGKWSSPSFYGQTVSLLAEGKGWSEASTFDLQKDCKDCLTKMKTEQIQIQKLAKQKAAAARNRAAWADNAAKAAQKRQKECTEEAKKRP